MSSKPPLIEIEKLDKSFGDQSRETLVLSDISLSVHKGEFITILGQSGCGKSTLLNVIGGFEKPAKGNVFIKGKEVMRPGRHCVMLFQDYGLLPWRSVLKNVELGLESEHLNPREKYKRAMKYIHLVGLENNSGQFPHQLSGGMKQRVAIARALAMKPELILMDEPFAALDTFNRYYLQDELIRLQKKENITIILVTHDIDEAIYLSDRIFMMEPFPGRIHSELNIDISKPRDRSNSDFQYFRSKIFGEFHMNNEQSPLEFNI